jgi:cell division protein FtsI (penicillin-binding protein 3)
MPPRWRYYLVLIGMAAMVLALAGRAAQLQLLDHAFLVDQADARHLRVAEIPAHRGTITDRSGEPLALSSPVQSVWANPKRLLAHAERLPELARVLDANVSALRQRLSERRDKEFVYLERHMMPERVSRVEALDIPGLALEREYHRFYPAGEIAGHVLGFTNIDDRGQEGIELAYNDWLSGSAGRKRVIQDQLGRRIEDVELLKPAQPGRDLALSIDRELQYLAYRELKRTVTRRDAASGSVIVLDVRSGEVLAMANQPSFNPNRRADLEASRYRNRAITDVFEPGSTLKPFTVAAALEEGGYGPRHTIDTAPGSLHVQGKRISDVRNYGTLDLRHILVKSSNVGAAKLALSLDRGTLWGVLGRIGLGQRTASGFPGEASGRLAGRPSKRPIERATLAFGYGVSVTALQLARSYAAIANDGLAPEVTLLREDKASGSAAERVLNADTARTVRSMLADVVSTEGTGARAAIPGYEVAGKTGTVKQLNAQDYSKERYTALFAGMAPAGDPRFVAVVVVNDPSDEAYYGGEVSAPVFSRVMRGALRLYNIAPRGEASEGQLVMANREPR